MSSGDNKKLHIVLTSYRGNMFCGGQGVYLVNLARALVALGHRVRVMSGPPYPEPVEGADNEFVPGENFINRPANDLPRKSPFSVFSPLTLLEYALARAGSNPEMLAFSLRCFKRIRQLHATDRVDVVHDNQGLGYGLLLVRALGIPVVATIHHPLTIDRAEDIRQTRGIMAKARRAIYYPPLMHKLVAKRLDRVITVSRFSEGLVADAYGLGRAGMAVVHNGVDPELFKPLPEVSREKGRLLFVGSTEDRKKGIVYLLRALARLDDRFKLVIVDGRRYAGRVYAKNLVEELGLDSRVEFMDKISMDELIAQYSRARMMVMPSLFEGFGLPALEAMASGTPLICTTAGALPEVADNKSALLVKPRSAEAIYEGVMRLDHDDRARERMAQKARERALCLFSWADAAKAVEEQYVGAITRSHDLSIARSRG